MATAHQAGSCASSPSLSEEKGTRIAIIDDHAIVREGLARLIRQEMELAVCGLFEGSQDVMESITAFKPDTVIVEIGLSRIDGIGLIKSMKMRFPQLPILVLSCQDEYFHAERALRAGASGYDRTFTGFLGHEEEPPSIDEGTRPVQRHRASLRTSDI